MVSLSKLDEADNVIKASGQPPDYLPLDEAGLLELVATLKHRCGTGGIGDCGHIVTRRVNSGREISLHTNQPPRGGRYIVIGGACRNRRATRAGSPSCRPVPYRRASWSMRFLRITMPARSHDLQRPATRGPARGLLHTFAILRDRFAMLGPAR